MQQQFAMELVVPGRKKGGTPHMVAQFSLSVVMAAPTGGGAWRRNHPVIAHQDISLFLSHIDTNTQKGAV